MKRFLPTFIALTLTATLRTQAADVELEVFAGEGHLLTRLEDGKLIEKLDRDRAVAFPNNQPPPPEEKRP